MATWAARRKFTYSSLVFLACVIFVGLPLFKYFYHAPTCSDGLKNGSELGVDCGGACSRLCQNVFQTPTISWVKYEAVAPNLYNVAAYIVNPNPNGAAINVPYKFTLFDKNGDPVAYTNGTTTLPAHRNTLAFKTSVDTGKSIPTKAIFEFTAAPVWQKSEDKLSQLVVIDKKYTEESDSSSLEVTVGNHSLTPYQKVYILVALYDVDGNTIGFSRTLIDQIDPGATEVAPFTWPISRHGKVATIEVLPLTVPTLD